MCLRAVLRAPLPVIRGRRFPALHGGLISCPSPHPRLRIHIHIRIRIHIRIHICEMKEEHS